MKPCWLADWFNYKGKADPVDVIDAWPGGGKGGKAEVYTVEPLITDTAGELQFCPL